MTTTDGPEPCETSGAGNENAAAPAADALRNCLRVARAAVMSIPSRSLARKKERRRFEPPLLLRSGDLQVVVLQRERADTLPGRVEVGVHHGRRRHQDGRLADATPWGVPARHQDRLHCRPLSDAWRVVGGQVGLLASAVL